MNAPQTIVQSIGTYAFAWGRERPKFDELVDFVQFADDAGLHSVNMPWHLKLDPKSYGWENDEYLEPVVVLSALARLTHHIRLGLTPFSPAVMHPYFWARFLGSLSAISKGRAFGLVRPSHVPADYTIAMSPEDTDFRRLDEGLDLIRKLLDGHTIDPNDTSLWDAAGLRLDISDSPRVPLWIGGSEDHSIERAARVGDVLRPRITNASQVASLRDRLSERASHYGRTVELAATAICVVIDPEDSTSWVQRHVTEPLGIRLKRMVELGGEQEAIVGTAEHCAERISDMREAGVDYFMLDMQFHGWESVEFATDQLHRLTENVLPLIDGQVTTVAENVDPLG